MLDEPRRRIPVSGVERRVGSAERIPIEDEAVGYVFANKLLHHGEEPSRAICETGRALRPGGVGVGTDPGSHEVELLMSERHDRSTGVLRGNAELVSGG